MRAVGWLRHDVYDAPTLPTPEGVVPIARVSRVVSGRLGVVTGLTGVKLVTGRHEGGWQMEKRCEEGERLAGNQVRSRLALPWAHVQGEVRCLAIWSKGWSGSQAGSAGMLQVVLRC